MHFKKIALTAGAVAAIAAPLGATSAASASTHPGVHKAATPACSFNCFNLSSELLGARTIQSVFVPHSNGLATSAKVGTKLDLKGGSDTFSNQDFTSYLPVTTLGKACTPVTVGGPQLLAAASYACLTLDQGNGINDPVIEPNWSPYGVESGLCIGAQNFGAAGDVDLQSCGTSSATIWVADTADAHFIHGHWYSPWLNGSSTNFSEPLVLHVNDGTRSPANRLQVVNLTKLTGNFIDSSDMFTYSFGAFL